jgi:hypothetical protein
MSGLSIAALIIGALLLAGGVPSVAAPAAVRRGLTAFPRSIWPGRVLAAVDLVWAAIAFSQMHLGMFDAWKVHLYWLTPVAIFLCIKHLDELLSVRALGGLLLLAAGPVLNAARWHPSDWRLVVTVIAYLWITVGLVFLLSPWWFRRLVLAVTQSDVVLRIGGAVRTLFGLGLILLALFVY